MTPSSLLSGHVEAGDVSAEYVRRGIRGRSRIEIQTWPRWAQARVVASPVKDAKDPLVLVKRNIPDLAGPRGEQLLYLPGRPVISLFTGAGGMDLGIEAAGWCVVAQHEWAQDACQTLLSNRPRCFRHAALIQGDIRRTPTSILLGEAGLRVGETHMVTGGPPCQGFSSANPKSARGTFDARNDLVFQFLRVVREVSPHFFIFENVPGFVRFNKHSYLRAFLEAASDSYFELVYGLVDAVEYGVPQYRCRFICMGTRRDLAECDGLLASLPRPQTFAPRDLKLIYAPETPAEVARRLRRAPGIRYFADRELLVPPAPSGHGDDPGRTKTFFDFYDRLERDEPDRLVLDPVGGE